MRKISSIVMGLFAGSVALFGAADKKAKMPEGLTVEPPCWWVGMVNDTLQLMVNAPGIANADFSVNYPGVKIDSQVALESKNYKFLYLTVSPDTKPGKVKIDYTLDGKKKSFPYELKARPGR